MKNQGWRHKACAYFFLICWTRWWWHGMRLSRIRGGQCGNAGCHREDLLQPSVCCAYQAHSPYRRTESPHIRTTSRDTVSSLAPHRNLPRPLQPLTDISTRRHSTPCKNVRSRELFPITMSAIVCYNRHRRSVCSRGESSQEAATLSPAQPRGAGDSSLREVFLMVLTPSHSTTAFPLPPATAGATLEKWRTNPKGSKESPTLRAPRFAKEGERPRRRCRRAGHADAGLRLLQRHVHRRLVPRQPRGRRPPRVWHQGLDLLQRRASCRGGR